MSQPRRRRRRRPRPEGAPGQAKKREGGQGDQGSPAQGSSTETSSAQGRSSQRRSRGRGRERSRGERRAASPESSEDIVRGPARSPGRVATAPHDGTTLEQVIGELQSAWGVPQHPQEYRITVKVAEERSDRNGGPASAPSRQERSGAGQNVERSPQNGERPREKAPAAPRIGPSGESEPSSSAGSRTRKRRSRRRRPRRSSGSG